MCGGRALEIAVRKPVMRLHTATRLLVSVPTLGVAALGLYVLRLWPGRPLVITVFSIVALAMCAGLASLLLTAWFYRLLAETAAAMRELAAGRFAALPATPFAEMRELTTAFNTMATQLHSSQQMLAHQAFHDPLTGLPNRAHFMARIGEGLARRTPLAVLFVDLDRFKTINDSLGHAVGDALLTVVGARLQGAAGDGLVARLGGDEFTVILEGKGAENRAFDVAEGILRRLQKPIQAAGHELFVNASVGIAIADGGKVAVTELLRRADIALYKAKAEGRGRYVAFRASHDVGSDQIDLDMGLRRAVERDQLVLVYQPEIDLQTGHIRGMEALLRWNHPHLGILPPAQFIAMAEETGEILNLGQWALTRACRETARITRESPYGKELIVSVNLSGAQFRDPTLATRVRLALEESGLAPRRLRLELTESVLVENISATVRTLATLRSLGVLIAIDDFGTGYSSLSYIQSFDAHTLKIDQAFVRRIGQDARSNAIIEAIVELARALSMDITAEGIETRAQAAYLARAGCQRGQGHYFAQPLAVEDFEAFISGRYEAPAAAAA